MERPDLRVVEYFMAVAEELQFGCAAERLHIAQPSLLSRSCKNRSQAVPPSTPRSSPNSDWAGMLGIDGENDRAKLRSGPEQSDRSVAIGIASSRRVDTIALRECDRWDALLGRADFRIARRIHRYHARVDTDGVSPLHNSKAGSVGLPRCLGSGSVSETIRRGPGGGGFGPPSSAR